MKQHALFAPFASPRRRRRLIWAAAAVLLVGLAVLLGTVLMRGTGNAFPDRFSTETAQLYRPEKKTPISKVELTTAREFIETAVAREDLSRAYDLVHPDLKGTMSRRQWDTGDIPVVGYPAANAKTASFLVVYSFQREALLEVELVARPGSQVRPELLFYLGLKRAGDKPSGRWLVDYWEPNWRPPVPMAPG